MQLPRNFAPAGCTLLAIPEGCPDLRLRERPARADSSRRAPKGSGRGWAAPWSGSGWESGSKGEVLAPDAEFFATERCETPRGRLVLLSRHFPPGQAAGARRWERLAQVAWQRGWGLDVLTLAPADLESRDDRRLESLPPGVRVLGVPARDHPLSHAVDVLWKRFRRLRPVRSQPGDGRSVATVDRADASTFRREDVLRMGYGPSVWMSSLRSLFEVLNEGAWANDAARAAEAIIDASEHRAIVSCGPPHMIHHAARRLSQRTAIPLVLDLRDPWSRNERVLADFATPLWYDMAQQFERRAFEHASLVAMNTPAAREVMRQAYPRMADKIIAVTNGFDEVQVPLGPRDAAFVIAYAGTIYIDRTPRNLFRAVRRVADELGLDASRLKVELMGHFDEPTLRAMSRAERVEEHVVLRPPGNVRDVAALLARSAMLVNLPQDSNLAIPSKIFEYMSYPAWILALATPDSATGQVLAGSEAFVVEPEDVSRIAAVIREAYERDRRGERPQPVARDPRLGRAHQGALLFDALERCLA